MVARSNPQAAAALLVAIVPLLYLQWQAPVRDVRTADDNGEVTTAYFQPLIDYLGRQSGPPFRIEIPFTLFHWEAYVMAPRFPLARGWERQLDIKYNDLFYGGPLTPATYEAWLHQLAVRFVAVSDADLDYSAKKEVALIDHGLPYLRLVLRTRHWRVYAVGDATPIVEGAATLQTLGANYLQLDRKPHRNRVHPGALQPVLGGGPGLGMRRPRRRVHAAAPSAGRDRCGWRSGSRSAASVRAHHDVAEAGRAFRIATIYD